METNKPEFTIDLLLENSCSNPEDFQEHEKWRKEVQDPWFKLSEEERGDNPSYPGWSSYRIELCCTQFVVIARQTGPGKYEIREYLQP